jgi:hypothetical protein
MIAATMSEAVEGPWVRLEPVCVGRIPPGELGPPSCYVTVEEEGQPLLRVDVYTYGLDSYPFQDAIVWKGNVVIGFGSFVHAVSLVDRSVRTIELGDYYGHMYPTAEYLLIATGEHLFRMEPDRSIRWQSDVLGIDGVIVVAPGPEIIRGEGEWDPPGGWQPFELYAATGLPTKR